MRLRPLFPALHLHPRGSARTIQSLSGGVGFALLLMKNCAS
jgi:hypothetical protein